MGELPESIDVLLVDDDASVAELTAEFLQQQDGRMVVETAPSAEAGLAMLSDTEFDCIVSDHDMPDENGIEFLRDVREAHPDVPFILFTGKGSEEIASEAISAGVTDYLQKQTGTDQYALLANRIRNAVVRTAAERERRRNERRFEAVFEDPNKLIGVLDTDGTLLQANQTAMEYVSLDRDAVAGRPFWETPWWDDSDRSDVKRWVERAAAGDYVEYEATHPSPDDEQRLVEGTIRPVTNDDDEVVSLVASARDVTDRKAHERRLEERRNLIKTLSTALPDYIFIYDDAGTYLDVLTGWQRGMEMYDPAELIGNDVADFFRADVADRIRSTITAALETGSLERIEYYILTTDEERRWYEGHVAPIPGGYRGEPAVILMARDITDRKVHEQRLQGQTAQIEALHDVATDLATCDTPEAVFDRIVTAAEEILEFDIAIADAVHDDALVPQAVSSGLTDEEYFEVTPIESDDNLAARALRAGESTYVDDLTEHDVAPASTEFRSALTVPIGSHGVFQSVDRTVDAFDATDRELTELLAAHADARLTQLAAKQQLRDRTEELARQNERLEEFVGIVSHDLRNPLNVAQGRLELAQAECDSPHIEDAASSVDRSLALIDDLLTLAREGERVGETEPVVLADLLEGCWGNVETADATLVAGTDRTVMADPGRLQQLFENLFRNAVEHGSTSPPSDAQEDAVEHGGTSVTVTVGDLADGFYVADDGPGIRADNRDQIFSAGYSTADTGSGFGLNIVREIADAHGWAVEVTESDAGGARFEFTGVGSAAAEPSAGDEAGS